MSAPVSTEPGCQHPKCVLPHPHAGPAILEICDWRGTPINAGSLVIYGAHYGSHSIGMVEAIVAYGRPFSAKGSVRLNVIRRAHSSSFGEPKLVTLHPGKLTVVQSIERSPLPTERAKWEERTALLAAFRELEASP